jgi:phosphoglycerate dehydrogenase-like enzyme
MSKYLSILTQDPIAYKVALYEFGGDIVEDIELIHCTSDPAELKASKTEILLADPDLAATVVEDLPHLQWLQSTWAGNKPLLTHPRKDYLLSGVKDVFAQQMAEYTLTHILNHEHRTSEFQTLQTEKNWAPPSKSSIKNKCLGIMGFGNIAQSMVPMLESVGLKIVGLNSSGETVADCSHIHIEGPPDKNIFASQCDYLLNLLPDTKSTYHFIDKSFTEHLPQNCLFINAGRGTVISDDVLLNALAQGQIKQAVLDVFEREPLPTKSVLWSHPKIYITQHTAAKSSAEDIIDILVRNFQRFKTKEPLKYQLSWLKGY